MNLPVGPTSTQKLTVVIRQIRRHLARSTTLHYSYKDCILVDWGYARTVSGKIFRKIIAAIDVLFNKNIFF